jgi:ferredoxin
MAFEEREASGLRIRIDRELCVGFGDCIKEAADAFVLDTENVAVFAKPELCTRDQLLAACEACPVDALTAFDESGAVVAPKR